MDLGLIFTFLREKFRHTHQSRGPAPSTAMPVARIREALEGGGSSDGRFAAGYLFHTAHISQPIGTAHHLGFGHILGE